jgi:hypothetical protein
MGPDQSRKVSHGGCWPMPWTRTIPTRFVSAAGAWEGFPRVAVPASASSWGAAPSACSTVDLLRAGRMATDMTTFWCAGRRSSVA